MMKLGMATLAAISLIAGPAFAGSRQSVSVNVRPAAAATPPNCTCSTAWCGGNGTGYGADFAAAFGYKNRRACDPYGHMYMSWSTNGANAVVKDENGQQIGTGASGKVGRAYSQYGTITWSVTCTGTPNEVGEAGTASCSDYTILSCFPAGTKITMLDAAGNMFYKNIEDIKAGETILSWDPQTQQFVPSVVTQPIKTKSNGLFEFKTADGQDLKITPTHEMYIDGKGFIPSQDVKVGDILITAPDGKKVPITSITPIDGLVDVYNLITDVPHDFFAENILVHNDNEPGHKDHGFTAGTMIQTMRGPVPIEQVKVGDKLIAIDTETGLLKLSEVRRTGTQQVAKTLKINGLRMGAAQPLFLSKAGKVNKAKQVKTTK